MAREFILSGFGLQTLKPIIYRKGQGQGLSSGNSGDYAAPENGLAESQKDYPEIDPEEIESLSQNAFDVEQTSFFGLPVFSDLRLVETGGGGSLYCDTILFEINQSKNIVTTSVQGRAGTVKEYISLGDFEVSIRGAIVNSGSNSYPREDVEELKYLLTLQEPLESLSDFLQIWGIYNLVVTDFRIPQQEGYQNVQLFEINCLSDTPEELIEEDA